MSREKKIYADQDPNWEGKDLKYWKLGFPRWWNPVFWLTVIMFPIIAGGYGFYTTHICFNNGDQEVLP